MWIQAKPLSIPFGLFLDSVQNIHVFFFLLSRNFSSSKIILHTFISIIVIMPYFHFHFFWRARQWTSHIPSSSAPPEQVLNKKQCTISVVTAACNQTGFLFVCFWKLLQAFMTWQSLQEPIAHISQQSDTSMWTQERQGETCYFFCFFSYRREIGFFLSAT